MYGMPVDFFQWHHTMAHDLTADEATVQYQCTFSCDTIALKTRSLDGFIHANRRSLSSYREGSTVAVALQVCPGNVGLSHIYDWKPD